MLNSVTILNFDGAYSQQTFYQKHPHQTVDFESIRNASLLCDRENLKMMYETLQKRRCNGVHYLGSGNYHYLSFLLQYNITKPYTLILFDHHTDTIPSPSENLISCGSWVLNSFDHFSMLHKVIMIGVGEDAKEHIPPSIQHKVILYTKNSLPDNTQTLLNEIETDSVYISIDKDVLNTKEAITDWDQGSMSLQTLLEILKEIIQQKEILGADVCGEYPVNPTNEYDLETQAAIEINNDTNHIIFENIKRWENYKSRNLVHYSRNKILQKHS